MAGASPDASSGGGAGPISTGGAGGTSGTSTTGTSDGSTGDGIPGDGSAGDRSTGAGGGDGGMSSTDVPGACVDVCERYGAVCCVPALGCVSPASTCVIEVLAATVDITYEYADLERKLASLSPAVMLSLTDTDIASVAIEPPTASRIELHLTAQASSMYGTMLARENHPFRVSCGGKSLFVGVTYNEIGAAAIKTPVLHVARSPADTLILGAWQGAAYGLGMATPGARERIDRPELRANFCQRGALIELAPKASSGL